MGELLFENGSQPQRQGLSSSVAFELNIQANSGFPTLVPSRGLEHLLDYRLLGDSISNLQVSRGDVSEREPQSVAIHIHCFYVDELALLLRSLEQCVDAFSRQSALFLTTDTEAKRRQIIGLIADSGLAGKLLVKPVQLVENRGRNLRPLFQDVFPLIAEYDIALHLHTKRSVGNSYGRQWLLDMLQALLPSKSGVRMILESFRVHPGLGLIIPQAGEVIRPLANWGSNFVLARTICANIFPDRVLDPQAPLVFPAGMMFWFRPAALQQMADACRRLVSLVSEPVAADGTLLHALERLSAHFCEAAGYRWALASLNPEDLLDDDAPSRMFSDFSVWAKNEEGYLHATRQLSDDLKGIRQQVDDLRMLCDQHASRIVEFQDDAALMLQQGNSSLQLSPQNDSQVELTDDAGPPVIAGDGVGQGDEMTLLRRRLVEILRCHAEQREQLNATLASREQAWQLKYQMLSSQFSRRGHSIELERQQLEERLSGQQQRIVDLESRLQQATLKLAEQLEQLDLQQHELSELHARHEESQLELKQLRQVSKSYQEANHQIGELSTLLASRDKQISTLQTQLRKSLRHRLRLFCATWPRRLRTWQLPASSKRQHQGGES